MERSCHIPLARGISLCAFLLCPWLIAQATDVQLLNGDSYDGKVQFINNQVVVVSQTGTNRIDLIDLLDATFRDDGPAAKGMLPAGVLLTDGSLVAGNVNGLDDPIKIGNGSIPLSSIAWVVFLPIQRDKISQPSKGQTGAILPTGDFFPGTIGGIKDDRIAINSALLGPQRFAIKGRADIAALVLRDVQPTAGRYQVSTRTGSIYAVNNLKSEGDSVVVSDPLFGDVKLNKDDIEEIRLANDQYQYLARMKPDHVYPPAGVDAATAVQVPQNADNTATENIQATVNATMTYAVPKGFTTFRAGASVPQGVPAGTRYTFAVWGDGNLLTRTPAVGPGDIAQHINVSVGNVHIITLRIEPASVGTGTSSALWIQPMFLR